MGKFKIVATVFIALGLVSVFSANNKTSSIEPAKSNSAPASKPAVLGVESTPSQASVPTSTPDTEISLPATTQPVVATSAPIPTPSVSATPTKVMYSAPATPGQTPTVAPAPTSIVTVSVYYANCTAAWNAGAAPVYRGQPGYRSALDHDDDGIGCEKDPR